MCICQYASLYSLACILILLKIWMIFRIIKDLTQSLCIHIQISTIVKCLILTFGSWRFGSSVVNTFGTLSFSNHHVSFRTFLDWFANDLLASTNCSEMALTNGMGFDTSIFWTSSNKMFTLWTVFTRNSLLADKTSSFPDHVISTVTLVAGYILNTDKSSPSFHTSKAVSTIWNSKM